MNTKTYAALIVIIFLLIGLYGYITLHPSGLGDPNAPSAPSVAPKTPVWVSKLDVGVVSKNWDSLLTYADAPPFGNPNAEYTLIEIGDFQCPQCGKVHSMIEDLITQSKGHAKLYFVNYPLQMHPHARFAAEAAMAAAEQGKFWQMYEVLYSHQDELIPSEVQYYAGVEIPGFNSARYLAALNSPVIATRVNEQIAEDEKLEIESTPTLFIRNTAGGTPSWYVGISDQPQSNTKGIQDLAASPPWASHS